MNNSDDAFRKEVTEIIKLSQNENPFGPSPKVLEALKNHLQYINRYPPNIYNDLKNKLSQKYSLPASNIAVSAGSVELIDDIIQTFIGVDDNMIVPEVSFVAFKLLAKVHNKECRIANMKDYAIDIEEMLALVNENTKVLFIANPNNPTGTIINNDQVLNLLSRLPYNTYLVLDEAYAEYVNDESYPDSLNMIKDFSNLIVLRSFSKIYGLGGLRIGYGFANESLITKLEDNKLPFSVNALALPAALAALDDVEYISRCKEINIRERENLLIEFGNLGYNVVPSHANFLFIHFEEISQKNYFYEKVTQNGFVVRPMDLFGDELAIRISVGTPEQNKTLINYLKSL